MMEDDNCKVLNKSVHESLLLHLVIIPIMLGILETLCPSVTVLPAGLV